MTAKATSKKAKTATPKAPPELYVEIDSDGHVCVVEEDPTDAEDGRESYNRLARYRFVGFVTVEFKAVVTDVAE